MSKTPRSTLKTLKAGGAVRLNGLTLIEVLEVGTPLLKASIAVNPLNTDDEVFLFNSQTEDWDKVEDPDYIVVGLGDRLMIGKIETLFSAYSNRYGEIRISMRTTDSYAEKLLNQLKGN